MGIVTSYQGTAVHFLEGPSTNPWRSAGAGHLESGQKHPDFRSNRVQERGPEPSEGVGGYEQWLRGKLGG